MSIDPTTGIISGTIPVGASASSPYHPTVTANDGTFDSKALAEKATFWYTFTKPGSYAYHCKIHASMKGSIVVEASDAK